ncbi:MAG TPA: DNA-binding response regulator [Ignavibacteriales bacterium]|nr:DNA-binding response regulator [Ignavibacteriales bacterium]
MKNNSIKILIADDHELFRKGIISLLLGEADIEIIGEANDGKDLIYKYLKLKPDLVISDISMPELSGLEAVSTIHASYPDVKAIFLSMYAGEDYIYHCLQAGGLGLINKDIPKEELLSAIHTVINGDKYFGKEFSDEKIQKLISNYEMQLDTKEFIPNLDLTEKEVEILLLIAEGLSSNDIADKLFIAKRTVDTHRTHIMQKLDLSSTPQLFKYATKYSEMINQKKSGK